MSVLFLLPPQLPGHSATHAPGLGIPKEFPRGSFDLGGLERGHSVSAPEQPWQSCQGDLREVWENPRSGSFFWCPYFMCMSLQLSKLPSAALRV